MTYDTPTLLARNMQQATWVADAAFITASWFHAKNQHIYQTTKSLAGIWSY